MVNEALIPRLPPGLDNTIIREPLPLIRLGFSAQASGIYRLLTIIGKDRADTSERQPGRSAHDIT
jgi:hypothetical protein